MRVLYEPSQARLHTSVVPNNLERPNMNQKGIHRKRTELNERKNKRHREKKCFRKFDPRHLRIVQYLGELPQVLGAEKMRDVNHGSRAEQSQRLRRHLNTHTQSWRSRTRAGIHPPQEKMKAPGVLRLVLSFTTFAVICMAPFRAHPRAPSSRPCLPWSTYPAQRN